MNLENLSQFNKRLFKKFLGVYINKQRLQLNIPLEHLSDLVAIPIKDLKSIESGLRMLTQKQFDLLCMVLELDPYELIHIGKITQVQSMLGFYKEIDEHYPA